MRDGLRERIVSVPKLGNRDEENEDRSYCKIKSNVLVALSDGATETALAKLWAETLVQSNWKAALLGTLPNQSEEVAAERVDAWIRPLREAFHAEHANKERPWYAREKVRQGSAATFLAFRMNRRGRWRAVTCGDTCLFQVDEGTIASAIPITDASHFGHHPRLISSKPGAAVPTLSIHNGVRPSRESRFLFATDALAAWLLDDQGNRRLQRLLSCSSKESFAELVESARGVGEMRNDDTTYVLIGP